MTNENNNEFLPETEEETVETIEETEEITEEPEVAESAGEEDPEVEEAVRKIMSGETAAIGFIGNDSKEKLKKLKKRLKEEKAKEKSTLREALEWVLCIGIAVILALLIRNFVFTFVRVDGNSMLPNLHHQDHLIVSRMGYEPEHGDIVVFHPRFQPKTAYVKRVIAVEGETVFIDYEKSTVYVNGEPLEEDYIDQIMEYRGPDEEVTVPEDCVFVLGDNRNNSRDSRFADVGFVTEESILGKATFRVWPLNSFGVID